VNIALRGARDVNPVGHSTVLTGAPEAENSLTNPRNVVPSTNTFAAGRKFEHQFPAHSISVLRIGVTAVE